MLVDVKNMINLWVDIFLNCWNCYKANGGIYFTVTIVIIVVFPILRRMVRAIRGGR